jgi:type IV fimbrial biogenesis protein FimT
MKQDSGFTLIELMVTLAVAAILATVAIPSFWNIIQSNRATTEANELVTALHFARSEAIKRGARISLCPSTNQTGCTGGADWSNGWIIFLDTAANDGSAAVVGEVLRVWNSLSGGTSLGGPANIRYRASGDVIGAGDFIHQLTGCTGEQRRTISVAASGRISVTRSDCV